jgi:uncharacterized protein
MKEQIASLHRYPVKGLSPEAIDHAHLETDGWFPGDRILAVENGPSGFNPSAAEHLPKQRFLMLMKHARLARLRSSFDPATNMLSFRQGAQVVAAGNVTTEDGRAAIEAYLSTVMGDELRGPPRVLAAPPGYSFTDSRKGFVSILNLGSVADIARLAGRRSLDPLRFRANIGVVGWPAWSEFGLIGQKLEIGTAILEVTSRIDRCAATDVDPGTGVRDIGMVSLLERTLGHHDCGVYARIVSGGVVATQDAITLAP